MPYSFSFLRDRRAELTVESVLGLVSGDFQMPMCKILGAVAAVAPALEHEKVFGWTNDSGLEKARPVNLSLKTPFFIKQRLGVPLLCPPVVKVGCISQHLGWHR